MSAHNAAIELHSRYLQVADPGNAGTITIDRNLAYVPLVSAGAETRTLARPTAEGVRCTLAMKTDGGDITVTVTGGLNESGDTTFVFSDAGQFADFVSCEAGGSFFWRKVSDYSTGNLAPVTAGTSAASGSLVLDSNSELNGIGVLRKQDTIIATAAVLTLNSTPVTVLAAPAAGFYNEFVAAYVFLDFATTAYAADAGEDLCLKYTDASGDIISTSVDGEEFEAIADALYMLHPVPTAPNVVTHLAAAVVAHVLVGNWATGDSPLKFRVLYRTIRTASLEAIA